MDYDYFIDGDVILGIVLYVRALETYSTYASMKRIKRLKRRRNFIQVPERNYIRCYHSEIYEGIMSNNDSFIRQHLRVSAQSMAKIIDLFPEQHHGFRILVFLYWLACGASYRVTGVSFNISRYTVRTIVHNMLDWFVDISPRVIKFPTVPSFEAIANGFNTRARTAIFEKALGAIDGCHVKITVPVHLRAQYINRKLDYSINLLCVCDSNGKLINIRCGSPGSVHDQRVLRNSRLYQLGTFPPPGFFLLGDSSFKCTLQPVAIITPFKGASTRSEKLFYNVHRKARSVIESAFGLMKVRWRSIFRKPLELKIKNSIKTIVACCVMHNICIDEAIEFETIEEIVTDDNRLEETGVTDDADAVEFRRILLENLSR